jgi:hypothetical protein
MTGHWLATPVNGYLGSGYGSDVKSLVQTPMAAGLAEDLIAKARQDIPLLLVAAPGALNVYASDVGLDVKQIVFEVSGELIAVDGGTATAPQESSATVSLEPGPFDTLTLAGASLLDENINITLPSQDYF